MSPQWTVLPSPPLPKQDLWASLLALTPAPSPSYFSSLTQQGLPVSLKLLRALLPRGCPAPSLTPHQHCFKHLPHLLQEFHQEKAWLLTMCSELSYQRRNPGLEKIIEGNGYALRHVKGLSLNSSSATHAVNVLSSPTSVSSSVKWGYHFLPCRVEKLYFMKNAN